MDRIPDEIIDLLRRFKRFKESGIRGNLTFTNTEAWWIAHYIPWIEARLRLSEAVLDDQAQETPRLDGSSVRQIPTI